MKTQTTFVVLLFAALFVGAAEAPKIDDARIDAVMAQIKTQMGESGTEMLAAEQDAVRTRIQRDLQRTEILKNAAFTAKLNENKTIENQLKNIEAQFYAQQYIESLKKQITVDESDLRRLYERLGREVKIQMAVFRSEAEARDALEKLQKGMNFGDLIASLTNQPASPPDFIDTQMLPPEFADTIDAMDKGKISSNPIEYQGVYYLLKVADVRKGSDASSYKQVKNSLIERRKDELVRERVQKLFAEYGLK